MKIRGSQAYNRKMYCDLMAMVTALGQPKWFLTLSSNDLNWADLWHLLQEREVRQHDEKRSFETIPVAERNKI